MTQTSPSGNAPVPRKSNKPSWQQAVWRVSPGLLMGLLLGLMITGKMPEGHPLRGLLASALVLILTYAALLHFPFVRDIVQSMQRAFLPKGAKAGLERWFWHNALAAAAMASLICMISGAFARR